MIQLDNLLELEVMLPSQYSDRRRSRTPEHRLMMAIVHDALECIAKYRFARDRHRRRLYDEARSWLLAPETDWPYSFEGICSVLGLDSDAVREHLGVAPAAGPRASDACDRAVSATGT
jgi:hypothetical protein